MYAIAKNTPADYPDLLAAVDAGISQRELARRYDCAPSLVTPHVARAKRARELSDRAQEPDLGLTAEPHNGSMREILEARVRDPSTSARDLASLTNALARLKDEETLASGPSIYHLRRGTLILEPEPKTDSARRPRRAGAGGAVTLRILTSAPLHKSLVRLRVLAPLRVHGELGPDTASPPRPDAGSLRQG